MISETSRLELMEKLEARNEGLWLEIVSQIHGQYGEMPIWVLVAGRKSIVDAYDAIVVALQPYLRHYADTKFSVSFDEYRDGKILKWNFIEDGEIRSGVLRFPLAAVPELFALGSSTVFETLRDKIDKVESRSHGDSM